MKRIFKYPIASSYSTRVTAPQGAVILHVGQQNNKVCVWAEVDENNPKTDYVFEVVVTGNAVPFNLHPAGTILLDDGRFVIHVYTNMLVRR